MKPHRSKEDFPAGAESRLLCLQCHCLGTPKLEDNGRNANNGADPGTHRPGQPQHSHRQAQEACLLGNPWQARAAQ